MALQGYTQPAPTLGLNTVGAIDNMDSAYALELVNIFPSANSPVLRNGYTQFVTTGANNPLKFLSGLCLSSGTNKIVGTDNNKIWEFSTGTAVNITGTTIPSNGNWNGDTFGQRLFLCNGVDNAQVYNGTTTTDITFTGPTLSNLISVASYKERIWFIEKNSLIGWFGNTKAVGASALTSNDFQYAFKNGGYLLFAGSWTNQLASTSADLFFACSSEGEILFYTGSSPADTSNWAIVARFENIGKPLSYRSFVRVNNDVWIITEQGIVPISQLFSGDPDMALETVGKQINPIIASYSASIGFNHMWHGVFWPQGRRVYIVIPTGGTNQIIAVYGIDSQGWTTYQLADAGASVSMAVVDKQPYYASSLGVLYKGETGYNDNGQAISFNGRTAFSFFGQRGNYKAFKDIRPLMKTNRGLKLGLGLDTNFQKSVNIDTITTSSGTFTPWGSPWGSPWSSGVSYIFDRFAVRGQGHCAAIRFQGSIKDAPLELYGFEIRFDLGGQV